MGLTPVQGELNAALTPLFAYLDQVHVIHDDSVIGAKNITEHNQLLQEVMQIIQDAGVTFNPKKCVLGTTEIDFWGLKISADGVQPDPKKK